MHSSCAPSFVWWRFVVNLSTFISTTFYGKIMETQCESWQHYCCYLITQYYKNMLMERLLECSRANIRWDGRVKSGTVHVSILLTELTVKVLPNKFCYQFDCFWQSKVDENYHFNACLKWTKQDEWWCKQQQVSLNDSTIIFIYFNY